MTLPIAQLISARGEIYVGSSIGDRVPVSVRKDIGDTGRSIGKTISVFGGKGIGAGKGISGIAASDLIGGNSPSRSIPSARVKEVITRRPFHGWANVAIKFVVQM